MDHDTAIREELAARYLLGELTAEQRDQFEDHFFSCYVCANDVRDGATLVANTRAVFRDTAGTPAAIADGAKGFWAWLRIPVLVPSAVAAVLAFIVAYQSLILIPGLKTATEPQLIASAVLHPSARGDEQVVNVPSHSKVFQVSVDINSTDAFAAFECEFIDTTGKEILKTAVTPGQVSSFSLLLPSERFGNGSYTLILRGVSGNERKEIDRFQFLIHKS